MTINRPTRHGKSDDYADEPPFAAEREIIVDQSARIKTNKNYGGDINPNA